MSVPVSEHEFTPETSPPRKEAPLATKEAKFESQPLVAEKLQEPIESKQKTPQTMPAETEAPYKRVEPEKPTIEKEPKPVESKP